MTRLETTIRIPPTRNMGYLVETLGGADDYLVTMEMLKTADAQPEPSCDAYWELDPTISSLCLGILSLSLRTQFQSHNKVASSNMQYCVQQIVPATEQKDV
jgi:hypothetical protein